MTSIQGQTTTVFVSKGNKFLYVTLSLTFTGGTCTDGPSTKNMKYIKLENLLEDLSYNRGIKHPLLFKYLRILNRYPVCRLFNLRPELGCKLTNV